MADRSELLENYYEELDPDKRRSLLDQYLSGSAPDDPVDRYRSALYDYRYTNPKEPGRKVDNYMWALLSLMYTHRESLIFPGRNVKAVRRIMKDLAQDERVHTDERFAEAFTLEVRNAVRRLRLPDILCRRDLDGQTFENGELTIRFGYPYQRKQN